MSISTTPDQLTDSELARVSGGAGSSSGITALILTTQLNTACTSKQALDGANKQKQLVDKEQMLGH